MLISLRMITFLLKNKTMTSTPRRERQRWLSKPRKPHPILKLQLSLVTPHTHPWLLIILMSTMALQQSQSLPWRWLTRAGWLLLQAKLMLRAITLPKWTLKDSPEIMLSNQYLSLTMPTNLTRLVMPLLTTLIRLKPRRRQRSSERWKSYWNRATPQCLSVKPLFKVWSTHLWF